MFQPNNLSGLFLWYKSTGNSSNNQLSLSNGAPITYWQDNSGSGNNLNLNTSGLAQAPQIIQNVINGYPAIRFNGTTNWMQCTPNNATFNLAPSSLTIFTLYQNFNTNIQQTLIANGQIHNIHIIHDSFTIGLNQVMPSSWDFSWGRGDGNAYLNVVASSYHEGQNFAAANQFLLRTDTFDPLSNNFAFYKFGAECATGIANMTQNTNNTITVGSMYNGLNSLSGDLIEITAYNRILSSGELQEVASYYFQKYQLQNTFSCPLFMYADTPSGLYKDFPLYMSGISTAHNSIPLYMDTANKITNSIPLYLDSSTKLNNSIPLYLDSATPTHSSISLFIWGDSYSSGHIPLYMDCSTKVSGHFTLYTDSATPIHSSIKLYVDSSAFISNHIPLYLDSSTKASGYLPLYIDSSTPIHSGFTLYTSGSIGAQTSHISLYVDSSTPIYSSTPLYLLGGSGESTGHLTLYIDAASKITSGFPLYTKSDSFLSGHMPLYLYNTPLPTSTNYLPLFTQASHANTHGLYTDTNLYMYGIGPHASMPLYLSTIKDSPQASMPLFISGPINTGHIISYTTLYLANNISSTNPPGLLPMVKMYVRGAGQLDGASISKASMPLFLYKNSGIYEGVNLFIEAAPVYSSSMPLYIQSAYFANSIVCMGGTTVPGVLSPYFADAFFGQQYFDGQYWGSSPGILGASSGGISIGQSPYFADGFFGQEYFAGMYWGNSIVITSGIGPSQPCTPTSLNMFVMGALPVETTGAIPLYMESPLMVNSGISLYMGRHTKTDTSMLYIGGF